MPIAALYPMQAASNLNDPLLAKDAVIAWFRGEFAAANAIIDALCAHLSHLGDGYESVFEAVHRRRINWIPVLQMQKYYSIAEVTVELDRVAAARGGYADDDDGVGKEVEAEGEADGGGKGEFWGTGEGDGDHGAGCGGSFGGGERGEGEGDGKFFGGGGGSRCGGQF
ncbi:hypothetical protein MLD38_021546 [Melastoma candidum]|uniref:Uncharacterized protein n=1 Tax=Melastoma candidum TaxID=119954 RepID=A0ACB9QGI6_9MYRT|nr:hypothetical protein MLD38_021546 [Melastoma candidum]